MRVETIGAVTVLVVVSLARLVRAEAPAAEAFLGRRIAAIEFRCSAPIDEADLRGIIPLHMGDALAAGELERARTRLLQREIFTTVAIDVEPRGDGVALIVQLERKPIVNSVGFRGNRTLRDSKLERIVRLAPSSPFSEQQRRFAEQRIRERYATEGFDEVQVTSEVQERAPGEVDLTFRIAEGQPLRVGRVEFDGTIPVPDDVLRHAAGIKAGARYLRAEQRNAEKAIVRALRTRGYYEATVESRWEIGEARSGTLRFRIDSGPLVVIRINGNVQFSERRILRLVDLLGRPIVTDGTWRELARRARSAYQEAGYYFAGVDVHIEPGPPKTVRFDIEEGPRLHVAAVDFDGNHGLSSSELRAVMQTQRPSWIPWRAGVLLDDVLEDDLKRLWFLYRSQGFESAGIVDRRIRFDRERGKIFVTVLIEEGPRTMVAATEYRGLADVEVPPELRVQPGVPLNPGDVENDRRALLGAELRAGHPHAEVSVAVSSEARAEEQAATVRFVAVPGPAERVGAIVVQNNLDTKSRVVLRELSFKSGDPLDPDALLRSQTRLYRLGLFRTVDVRPLEQEPTDGRHDVGVSLLEKAPGSFQVGTGYNTRDGLRGFLEVSNNNLQGLNRRLSVRGEMSLDSTSFQPNEYLADAGYRDPRVGDSRWTVRNDLVAQRSTRSVDQFSVERFALIPAVERAISPEVQAGSEVLIEQSQVFDVASDVLAFNPRDQGRLRTVGIGPFLVYEGRDDPFMPRRGVFDSLRLRWAPQSIGSDVPFIRIQAQHSQYVPLSDVFTFIYAVRAGWELATESGDQVPIRERFFLGGRTTVRGFSENSIGPSGGPVKNAQGVTVASGDPIGGDLLVNVNTEVRFPLAFGAGGAVFVDGGGLYLQDTARCKAAAGPIGGGLVQTAGASGCDINLDNFRRSSGLGLRYDTPVGPLSLDYGFKLDRRGDESIGEVHFSIGANW